MPIISCIFSGFARCPFIPASLLTKFVGNIKNNIESVDKEAKAFDTSTAAPTGDVFADATIGSRQTEDIVKTTDEGTFTDVTTFQKFTDGWGTTTGGTIKFEITAKNIGMIYYMTVDGKSVGAAVLVSNAFASLSTLSILSFMLPTNFVSSEAIIMCPSSLG